MADVFDNFNRADENPLSNGGKWQKPSWAPVGNMIVVSNRASSDTQDVWCSSLWTGNRFSNNQFSQIYVNNSGNYAFLAMYICMNDVVQTGYAAFVHSWVANLSYIYRFEEGASTIISSLIPFTCDSRTVRLGISGTTITLDVGANTMSVTDSSPITSGYPGIGRASAQVGTNGGMLYSDWSGGPIVTRPDFSPFPFPRLD
jgi:hypothetical protein